VIVEALYGLRSSGARWHEASSTLVGLIHVSQTDVWMKNCGTYYEYVCVFVDDLAVMMKNPDNKFFVDLKESGGYSSKGEGEIKCYHIGGDFFSLIQMYSAKTYVDRILTNCKDYSDRYLRNMHHHRSKRMTILN
jgi:hypothetical protein